ncbi:replication factor C 37kDa subunit [Nosema bombycis CQ1]|uniref:Replication factor C 37kDa subunit n=1 Tax=Nosema bombycis (strain CQ1 / CVCC 102059) TaxID=578461 RepID=R0MF87_NOSB1|nr:replication factor C 37kDa subunit [Nosema bombycis CQ1]EOB12800.1 replication factor C 37kDa subunit [Nosema bombycis CQ1]|eukprot:EOB12793.1 replication factor C 37kDa subunit [Nosema bombycis CQ1]
MRQSLNVLQPCINSPFEITEEYIIKLVGVPSPRLIGDVLNLLEMGFDYFLFYKL